MIDHVESHLTEPDYVIAPEGSGDQFLRSCYHDLVNLEKPLVIIVNSRTEPTSISHNLEIGRERDAV